MLCRLASVFELLQLQAVWGSKPFCGEKPIDISHQQEPHIHPSLKNCLSKDPSVSTNVEPHEAHTPRKDQLEQSIENSHPMGKHGHDLTHSSVSQGFRGLWQSERLRPKLVLRHRIGDHNVNPIYVFSSSAYPADQGYPWLSHFRQCDTTQSIHGFGNVKLLGQFCQASSYRQKSIQGLNKRD